MTCRDFERAWNELLDAEASRPALGPPESAARCRASACWRTRPGCPNCRQVPRDIRSSRRAIRAWGPPPAPPAGLAERILAEIQAPTPSAWPD